MDAQSKVEWEKAGWVACEGTCSWRRTAPVSASRTMSGAVVAAARMFEEKAEGALRRSGHWRSVSRRGR